MGNPRSRAASSGAGVIFLPPPVALMRRPRSYMACNSAAGTTILMTILDFNSASVTCSKNISAASCPSDDLNMLGWASSRKRCSASLAVLDPIVRPKMRIVSGVGCSICHGRTFFSLGFSGVKNEPTKIKTERMPILQYSLRSMVIFERGLLNACLILLCHKRSRELTQLQCGQKPSSPTSAPLKCRRNEVVESGTWRCARWAAPRDVIFGNGRHFAFDEVFFAAGGASRLQSLRHQKPVSRYAHAGMMMEPAPTPTLIVSQPHVLL